MGLDSNTLDLIFVDLCRVTGEMISALTRRRMRADAARDWAKRLRDIAKRLDA